MSLSQSESDYQKVTKFGFSMKGDVKRELINYYESHLKGKEQILCVAADGLSGAGKSVGMMQFAAFFAELRGVPFGLENIIYSESEFMMAVKDFPEGSIIFWDEGMYALSSKRVMTSISQKIQQALDTVRQKKFIIFFLCQRFKHLSNTMADENTSFLFRFSKHGGVPGHYCIFGKKGKAILYSTYHRRDFSDLKNVRPLLYGKTENFYVVDEQAYKDRKFAAFQSMFENEKVPEHLAKQIKNKVYERLYLTYYEKVDLTQAQLADIFGVTRETVNHWTKKLKPVKGESNYNEV